MNEKIIYDVLIIGAGAAGYGTALTLASVEDRFDWSRNKKYLMIDDGQSDILKASFFNLAAVDFGIGGDRLLMKMKAQIDNFQNCNIENDTVISIENIENNYKVIAKNKAYEAKIVVIATGMHRFDIKCDGITVSAHKNVMKSGKIFLKNNDNKIKDGLYVAGLASGKPTMFAIANGDGVKVACDIFKEWTGKSFVAHDLLSNAKVL